MIFLAVLPAIEVQVNSTLQKFHGCKMTEKWPLMVERYPLGINCLGIENLSYLFENRCLITLEGVETPMAYCSIRIESLRFDQCFWAIFPSFCNHEIFIK